MTIAHWRTTKRSPGDILGWLEKDKTISDEDLSRPAVTKVLYGANPDPMIVNEALWNHFNKNAVQFFATLLQAEENKISDASTLDTSWEWLCVTKPDILKESGYILELLECLQKEVKFVPGETFQRFDWLTPAEVEKIEYQFYKLNRALG